MKILFLAPYPFGEVASQRFRFEQYFRVLREENILFRFLSFYPLWTYRILYQTGHPLKKMAGVTIGYFKRIAHTLSSVHYDFVFIHRELTPAGPPVFEWIITHVLRKKIIYDFDDAIWLSDHSENRFFEWLKDKDKVRKICSWSHKISCGNSYLSTFALQYNQKVFINPTTIDTEAIEPSNPEKNKQITIGWTGSHSTLVYLRPLLNTIERVLETFSHTRFLIICNKKPEWEFGNFDFIRWNKQSEWDDLSLVDIGIMPLTNDDWTRGKCGFKILQYFALGIPAIASPVGVNREIIQPGSNGFLCDKNEEWFDTISMLIKDDQLREITGRAGINTLKDHFSLTANRLNFLRLFE